MVDLDNLSIEYTKRLNEIYQEKLKYYIEFLNTSSRKHDRDVFWWCTFFACNDDWGVKVYENICKALLAIELHERYGENVFCTLNRYLAEVLNGMSPDIEIICTNNSTARIIRDRIGHFYAVYHSMKGFFRKALIIRKNCNSNDIIKEKNLIFTDVFSSNFDTGEYVARDFKRILDFTDEKICFVPYLFVNNDMSFVELIRKVTESKKYKFYLREQTLNIIDFLMLGRFWIKLSLYERDRYYFDSIDISSLVIEQFRQDAKSWVCYYGLMNYQFIKKIKKKGVVIERVIDWYEAQPSSIGLSLGLKEFFPEVYRVGYTAYPLDKNLIGTAPYSEMINQQVAPDVIGIMGDIFENIILRYDDRVSSLVMPAFRYESYKSDIDMLEKKNLLVVLPYSILLSKKILEFLDDCAKVLEPYKLLIRNHPVNRKLGITDYIDNFSIGNYIFVNESYADSLSRTEIVITAESSTTYEAALAGKKVMIIAETSKILRTYVPDEICDEACVIIYNEQEFEQTLRLFQNIVTSEYSRSDKYCCEVNRESVSRMFK